MGGIELNINMLIIKLQTALINRKNKKIRMCTNCNETVVPLKEISILNILAFVIIGLSIFFITKDKIWLLFPVLLSILNSLMTKAKCPKCKSKELREINEDE